MDPLACIGGSVVPPTTEDADRSIRMTFVIEVDGREDSQLVVMEPSVFHAFMRTARNAERAVLWEGRH